MKKTTRQNLLRTAFLGGCIALAGSLNAADVVKTNNTDNLTLGSSWVGGSAPTTADVAVWDSTVTSANTTLLGASTGWRGIRIANPGGLITIGAGNTLTNGASGIDMTAATQDLTLNNTVFIAPGALQKWNVAPGRLLTSAAVPTKLGTPTDNTGVLEVGSSGSVYFGTGTNSIIADNQGNPWVTYGPNDWAALSGGQVVAANYADVTTALSAGTNNNIIGDLPGGAGSSVDCLSVRFNDPTFRTLNIANSGTSRTLTARGVLVTANSGGGLIGGQANTSNIRPARSSVANTSFNIIQNSPADFTISAMIQNGSSGAPTRLVKSGPGNLIISGALNGYTGGTDVNGGTLTIAPGANLGLGAVTVNGGTFAGTSGATVANSFSFLNGTTSKVLVQAANGQFTQGDATFSGVSVNVVILSGSGVPLSTTTAPLKLNGTATVNGTVNISVLNGSVTTGTFPLIQATNGFAGAGSFALATLPPRVVATLNTNGNTLELVVSAVNQPVTWTKGSETWNFSSVNWQDAAATPTTYQEISGLGDSVFFQDSLSGSSPITVTLNTNVTPASVTFSNSSKTYTLSGTGSIRGQGTLTKAGAGTLTLANTNTFSGGLRLNGGTTVFSSLTNLGSGGITFGGGTLQYNGNTDDISVRPVTFNAGNGGIDVGAGSVNFANGVGNAGAGGLTKLGTGILTLNATNNYSGNTTISQGTLALSGVGAMPNSANIVLSSGAKFDVVGSSGYTLSASANQKLSGVGVVNGNITVPSGTAISPATSSTTGSIYVTNFSTITVGGTLELNVTTSGSDYIEADYLIIQSGATISVPSPALTNGLYKIIQANGFVSGSLSDFTFNLGQPGKSGELVLVSTNFPTNTIYIEVSDAASDDITWNGSFLPWDQTGTANWYLTGTATPWAFTNGDIVRFDEVGAANGFVYLSGSLKPSLVVVSNPVTDYSFNVASFGDRISGSARLLKQAAGKLTINTGNDNTGSTTIEGGTLEVGSLGSLGTGAVTNNANLIFSQTVPQTVPSVSGSGGLTRGGSSTVTVAGAANYTGPTTINSGTTLQIGSGGAQGVLSTSAITNNGILNLNSTTSWTYSMPDDGTGIVVKDNTNTLTMSGVNTRTGETRVNAGKIILGNTNQLQGSARVEAGGILDINGRNQILPALTSTLFSGGVVANNAGTSTNTLTVSNAAASDFSGIILNNQGSGGIISFVKQGAGELNLRGDSTYTGGSIVQDGAVRVSSGSPLGAGPVNMTGGNLVLGGNSANVPNTINFLSPSTQLTIQNAQPTLTGTFKGTGDLVMLWTTASRTFTQNGGTTMYEGLTNTLYLTNGTAGPNWLRFNSGSGQGASGVTFDLSAGVTINSVGAQAINLGALSSQTNGAWLQAANGSTFTVGAKNLSTTFAGTLGTGINNFIKVGTGTLGLSGPNTFSGFLTVSNGTLALSGDGAPTNMTPITVVSNATLDVTGLAGGLLIGDVSAQTLMGRGTINGSVVVGTNGTVSPGTSYGTLSISSNATFADQSVLNFELSNVNTPGSGTNDLIQVGGNLSLAGGTGTVYFRPSFPAAPVTGVAYTIITYTGGLTGNASNLALDPTVFPFTHLSATFNTSTPNIVTVTFAYNPANIVWKGNVSTSWEASAVANWLNGATPTNYFQYDNVTFNDTAISFTVAMVGNLVPNSITVNSSSNYVFTDGGAGVVSGATSLSKQGTGTLSLSTVNTYSGGTTVGGGVLDITGQKDALGSGAVALNGVTLQSSIGANGAVIPNNIIFGAGTTNTLISSASANTRYSSLSGGGSGSLVRVEGISPDFTGVNSYAGVIQLTGTNPAVTLRLVDPTAGSAAALWNLGNVGAKLGTKYDGLPGYFKLGALTGGTNSTLSGHTSGGGQANASAVWEIGALNTTTTFEGVIRDGDGDVVANGDTTSLVKVGTGMLTLSGTNTYTGLTTVSNGTLRINVPYLSGATNVVLVTPGKIDLNYVGTNVVKGIVTNGVSLAGGVYNSVNLSAVILGTGSLQVPSTGPSGPGYLTNSVVGGTNLMLSWPAGQGWRLQSQITNRAVGLNTNWVYVTDSSASSTNITINKTDGAVFYRLVYP